MCGRSNGSAAVVPLIACSLARIEVHVCDSVDDAMRILWLRREGSNHFDGEELV